MDVCVGPAIKTQVKEAPAAVKKITGRKRRRIVDDDDPTNDNEADGSKRTKSSMNINASTRGLACDRNSSFNVDGYEHRKRTIRPDPAYKNHNLAYLSPAVKDEYISSGKCREAVDVLEALRQLCSADKKNLNGWLLNCGAPANECSLDRVYLEFVQGRNNWDSDKLLKEVARINEWAHAMSSPPAHLNLGCMTDLSLDAHSLHMDNMVAEFEERILKLKTMKKYQANGSKMSKRKKARQSKAIPCAIMEQDENKHNQEKSVQQIIHQNVPVPRKLSIQATGSTSSAQPTLRAEIIPSSGTTLANVEAKPVDIVSAKSLIQAAVDIQSRKPNSISPITTIKGNVEEKKYTQLELDAKIQLARHAAHQKEKDFFNLNLKRREDQHVAEMAAKQKMITTYKNAISKVDEELIAKTKALDASNLEKKILKDKLAASEKGVKCIVDRELKKLQDAHQIAKENQLKEYRRLQIDYNSKVEQLDTAAAEVSGLKFNMDAYARGMDQLRNEVTRMQQLNGRLAAAAMFMI